jgi:hypothetical protein
LHLVGKNSSRSRRRKGFPVLAVERNGFLDDLTELVKHHFLVRSVASSEHQSGGTPDIALILFRTFDDFDVPGAVFDFFDSSMTNLTVRI